LEVVNIDECKLFYVIDLLQEEYELVPVQLVIAASSFDAARADYDWLLLPSNETYVADVIVTD